MPTLILPSPIPSLTLTPEPDAENPPMPSIDYAPSPIRCRSSADLFYAFECAAVDASGAVGASQFWDHAAGGWGPTFDPTKHVAAMSKVDSTAGSPNAQFQGFGVPYLVATASGATALLYTKDGSGNLVPWGLSNASQLASDSAAT